MLPPPNPIITKNVDHLNEKVNFKMDYIKQTIESEEYRSRLTRIQDEGEVQN